MELVLVIIALVLLVVGIYLVRRPVQAASSAPTRTVVDGYEVFTTPTTCAIRRDEATAVSVTFVREGAGLTLSTPDPVAERFLDQRVKGALAGLPKAVTEVVIDREWVRARGAGGESIPQLISLADAAYTLPPEGGYRKRDGAADQDPTRPLRVSASGEEEEPAHMDLPKRGMAVTKGTRGDHLVAVDDVEPIAAGETPEQGTGARATRKLTPSSIFTDGASKSWDNVAD